MVKALTPNQRSAIERAKRNPQLKPILFRKAVGVHWWTPFKEAGFLNPLDIPPPTPSKEAGYVNIPFWPITEYLVATSPEVLSKENEPYAIEFLEFIRNATNTAKNGAFGNYRVWMQFSKVFRNVPVELITLDDLQIIDYWLDDSYERGLVAESLGSHWLIHLLDRDDPHSKALAVGLLEILYKTKFSEKKTGLSGRKEAALRFDSWHAKKITGAIAVKVGQVLELEAVTIFERRLDQVLVELGNDKWSSIWRAAIEDHEQNHAAEDVADILIEGLRDSLLAMAEKSPELSEAYVRELLNSPLETLRRVAIHAIDRSYLGLRALVGPVLDGQYFTSNFRHELWHLLRNHYLLFSDKEKAQALDAIVGLKDSDEAGNERIAATAYKQAVWLAAIQDHNADIAKLYRQRVEQAGAEPEHPDFSSYSSAGWVNHQSPIPIEEMRALTVDQLVQNLSVYEDPGRFGEPGIDALAKALRQLVKTDPLRFHNQLEQFLALDLAYVHEVIEAYADLWTEKAQLPWNELWPAILEFCGKLVKQENFWSLENSVEKKSFVANRHWIVSSIGRLIEGGVKSDDHALPEENMAQCEDILRLILERQEGNEFSEDSDAVFVAINSPRGRGLEAYINLTLRAARLADTAQKNHTEAWAHFQPQYEIELARAERNEYEFATLVVNYLPNFLYLSKEWVVGHLGDIFDCRNYQKWLCAMQGYAYVGMVYEEIYRYLKVNGHFLRALDDENLKEKVDEKIIQNIVIAYVNDFEDLNEEASLIRQLVSRNQFSELSQLIWFFWTLRKDDDQQLESKALNLWSHLLGAIDLHTSEGRKLASKLSSWTVFIREINDESRPLIFAVAPYAEESYNSYELLGSIARISKNQPAEAYEIWRRLLESAHPSYPTEAIQTSLSNLVKQGAHGVRQAKEIVGQYVGHGNEEPHQLLQTMLQRAE